MDNVPESYPSQAAGAGCSSTSCCRPLPEGCSWGPSPSTLSSPVCGQGRLQPLGKPQMRVAGAGGWKYWGLEHRKGVLRGCGWGTDSVLPGLYWVPAVYTRHRSNYMDCSSLGPGWAGPPGERQTTDSLANQEAALCPKEQTDAHSDRWLARVRVGHRGWP